MNLVSSRLKRFVPLASLVLVACAGPKAAERPTTPAPVAPADASEGPVSGRAERIFNDANELYAAQLKQGAVNYDKLAAMYQQSAQASPGFAEPMFNLGLLYQRQGKVDEATAAYTEALRRKPSLTPAIANLAGLEIAQGRAPAAQAMLLEATHKYPHDAGIRARLAEVYLALGDLPAAKSSAKDALTRDPKNGVAYRVLMEIAQRQGDDEMVRLLALRAQKANPEDPATPYQLGRLYEKHKQTEKAVAQYRASLALDPNYPPSLTALAGLAVAQGDYVAAETYLRRVLQTDSRACGAHLDLGVCEKAMGHPDQALVEYQTALSCDSKLYMAHYNRALVYHRVKSDWATAIDEYRKFITQSPQPLPGDHQAFAGLQECQQLQALAEQRKTGDAFKDAPAPAATPAATPAASGAATPSASPTAAAPAKPAAQNAPEDPNEPKN
jgi:tetratricopeptide (TPR) repeat protein